MRCSLFSKFTSLLVPIFLIGLSQDTAAQSGGITAEHLDSLEWRGIGPAMTSGRISDIAAVEADPKIIYITAATGGAWKSTNHGDTWENVFDDGGTASLGAVAVTPTNPHLVWLGAGESWEWRSVSWGDGVYKSEDGGKTWDHKGLDQTRHIGEIVIHPEDEDTVYVAGLGALWGSNEERGVFKTTDGGETWDKVLFVSKFTGMVNLAMDPRDPDVLYAAAFQRERRNWSFLGGGPESGIYKTTDGGETWQELTKDLPKGDMGHIGLSVCRSQSETVYASINAHEPERGLYRSDDRGASWEQRSELTGSRVRCDPMNPERVYLLRNGDSVSEDGGKTFSRNYAGPAVHVDQQAMWIDPADPDHIMIGNDGGFYITMDGGKKWAFAANLPVTQFYTVSLDLQEPFYYVYGGTQDNNSLGGPSGTRNTDGIVNDDWYITVGGDGFHAQIDPTDPTIVYTESQYGRLVRFDTRTGERRLIQPQPPEGEKYRWNWSSTVLISQHDPKTIYFVANKVFRSRDRGDSWETISPDLTLQMDHFELPLQGKAQPRDALMLHRATSDYSNITTLSESPIRAGVLAVGTDDGTLSVTRDDGANWKTIKTVAGVPEQTRVSRVFLSHFEEGTIYAAFDAHKDNDFKPYVAKSADFGESWTPITGNLPEFGSTRVIVEHPKNPNLLFVGTEFSAFLSTTGGGEWIQLKNNLPTVPVHDIKIHPRENDLVLGTHGRGFWILDDIAILDELTKERASSQTHLARIRPAMQMHRFNRGRDSQGHRYYRAPNPPDGAIISYWIHPSLVTAPPDETATNGEWEPPMIEVDILDAEGDLVRRLESAQGAEAAGIQRLVWDLRHALAYEPEPGERIPFVGGTPRGPFVMPGEYRIRLKVGNHEQTQKVEVRGDSAIDITDTDRRVWHDTLMSLMQMQATSRAVLSSAEEAEEQIGTIQDNLKATQVPPSLTDAAKDIAREIDSILLELRGEEGEEGATQPGARPLHRQINRLYANVEASTAVPTADQRRSSRESHSRLSEQVTRLNEVLSERLPALYQQLDQHGVRWTPGRPIKLPPDTLSSSARR